MLAQVEPRLRQSLPAGHYAFATLASAKALNALLRGNVPTAMELADRQLSLDEEAIKAGKGRKLLSANSSDQSIHG